MAVFTDEGKMIICDFCKEEIRPHHQNCPRCGAPVKTSKKKHASQPQAPLPPARMGETPISTAAVILGMLGFLLQITAVPALILALIARRKEPEGEVYYKLAFWFSVSGGSRHLGLDRHSRRG